MQSQQAKNGQNNMKDTSKNGAGAANQNGTSTTAATPVAEIKKVETPKVEPPKIESNVKTLEEQRQRSQNLNDLFEKEKKLTESRGSLKSFRHASDEDTNVLELRDGKGRLFKTGNPAVIAEVIKLVMTTLDEKITDVQLKIINC